MNYSKTIREYCLQNKGNVFDVSYEMKTHFDMVPYKTLLKILNRLEEEGIIKKYSKGLYIIINDEPTQDPIISFYASDMNGVVVGYAMYNKYELTTHQEKPIVIYTRAMETTTKNIGDDYQLIRYPLFIFDNDFKSLIEALDIIENSPMIIDLDVGQMSNVICDLLQYYKDEVLRELIRYHKYQYSTLCTLERMLNDLHVPNKVMEVMMSNHA